MPAGVGNKPLLLVMYTRPRAIIKHYGCSGWRSPKDAVRFSQTSHFIDNSVSYTYQFGAAGVDYKMYSRRRRGCRQLQMQVVQLQLFTVSNVGEQLAGARHAANQSRWTCVSVSPFLPTPQHGMKATRRAKFGDRARPGERAPFAAHLYVRSADPIIRSIPPGATAGSSVDDSGGKQVPKNSAQSRTALQ